MDRGLAGCRKEEQDALRAALSHVESQIDRLKIKWDTRLALDNKAFGPIAHEAIADVQRLTVPMGDLSLLHVWRTSKNEWNKVLASCTYKKYPLSNFVMYAFGETLCRIKSAGLPCRLVSNDILACYKVNAKLVQQVTARDGISMLPEDVESTDDAGEF